MKLGISGQILLITWAGPVKGKYTLSVTAQNSAGLSSQASVPIPIDAK